MKKLFFIFFLFPALILSQCIEGDCIDGYGKILYENNNSYEGYFKNGKLNGRIIITSTNGERKVCTYKNNQIVSYIPCEALSN